MTAYQCNSAQDKDVAAIIKSEQKLAAVQGNSDGWGTILGAGPLALTCLAQSVLVANSHNSVAFIRLQKTGQIKYDSLRTNLQDLSDLGDDAFSDAEHKMRTLARNASNVCCAGGMVDRMIGLCQQQNPSVVRLEKLIDSLEAVSKDCVGEADQLVKRFEDWSTLARDIVKATRDEDDATERRIKQVESEQDEAENKLKVTEKQLESTSLELSQETANVVSATKRLDEAQARAQAFFDPSWNRVIKSTILKVDPSSVVKGVTQIAQASLLSGWSRAAMAYVGSIGISPDEAADKATKARYEKLDDFRDIHNENHALAILHRLHMPLASLKKNLKARNGDPDWDILLGKTLDTGGDLTLSLEYMSKELAAVVAKYPPCPDDAAHANADRFLSSATKLVGDVQASEADGQIKEPTTEKVEEWSKVARDLLINVERETKVLEHLAQKRVKFEEKEAKAREREQITTECQQIIVDLHNAEANLVAVKERHLAAQQAAAELGYKQLNDGLEILLLSDKSTRAGEVKEILGRCLNRLDEFKAQLKKFVQFFIALHGNVAAIRKSINDDIKEETWALSEEREKAASLALIRNAAAKVFVNFRMAGEGADIYVAVSRAHIMPGISQIDALMAKGIESRGKAEMMEQITKIGDISKKAQEDINRFAKKRLDDLVDAHIETKRLVEEVEVSGTGPAH